MRRLQCSVITRGSRRILCSNPSPIAKDGDQEEEQADEGVRDDERLAHGHEGLPRHGVGPERGLRTRESRATVGCAGLLANAWAESQDTHTHTHTPGLQV